GSCSAGARSSTEVCKRTGRCRCSAGRALCVGSMSPLPWVDAVVLSVRWSGSGGPSGSAPCARCRPARFLVVPDPPPGKLRRGGNDERSHRTEVLGPSSEQAGDHLLGGLREALLLLLEVGLPGRQRPDLEAVQRADDGALPVQIRVGAQVARDGDAPLLVRGDVLRTGAQHAQVVT